MKLERLRSQQKDLAFSCRLRSCVLGCAVFLAAAHAQAQAHFFCVSNAAELQGALTDASDGGMYNGEDNVVEIVKGTYKVGSATGNGPFHYHSTASSGGIYIHGGYDAGCSTGKPKASLTVLDGNHTAQVLSLFNSTVDVYVTAVTIQNGETAQAGGGLAVNVGSGNFGNALIESNIIRNNHTTGQAGGLYVTSGGGSTLYVVNNAITGNSADNDYGAGAIVGNTGAAAVEGNTVTRNTTTHAGGTGGLYFGGSFQFAYIVNSIFWNNTHYGIYLGSGNVNMKYSDYGMAGGSAPSTSVGNLSVNPSFIDAAGGDFHLAGDSPLLGKSSALYAVGFDPDGILGPKAGKVDMGAYYETIFIDDFDGN